MKEWQDLGRQLKGYINVDTFPVAIRFLKNKEDMPEGTRTPLKHMKVKMAHCQVQTVARKYG